MMAIEEASLIDTRLEAAAAECAKAGGQLTDLRRQVLALILRADTPLTAYQLLDRLKKTRNAVPATIYRAVEFLLDHHLIHRVERLNAFIACSEVEHAHHAVQLLICRQCGTVDELQDRATTRALTRAAQSKGFHPGTAMIELDGICAVCAQA